MDISGNHLKCLFVSLEKNFPGRNILFEYLVWTIISKYQDSKLHMHIHDFPLVDICLKMGFVENLKQRTNGIFSFTKIPSPILVTEDNWINFRKEFMRYRGWKLPHRIPREGERFWMSKSDQIRNISLSKLEKLLSPTLILLPSRSGVIVPITPAFADDLLKRDNNYLPFPKNEAFFRFEKVYYRKPSLKSLLKPDTPVLFYVSETKKGIIGFARITSVLVRHVDTFLELDEKHGVLDENEIRRLTKNGIVQALYFTGFKAFDPQTVVPLARLREIGCAKASFIGPEKVSYNQLSIILKEGLSDYAT